jgi:drug/metabolite transporter (DMT)-like permease
MLVPWRQDGTGSVASDGALAGERIWDRRLLLGILFICLSGIVFPVMNGFAKMLGAEYSTLQVSWARAFGHFVFLLIAFLPKEGLSVLRTRRPMIQFGRAMMLYISNLCFFFAVVYIPIADAAAISMTSPLVVALLAWPMLGERTTVGRLAALGLGFLGVLIIIRPGTDLFHWASLFVVASSCCYGMYQIFTRKVAGVDSPETSAIYAPIIGAIGMLVVMPFVWRTPTNALDIGMFVGLGVLGAAGHYFVARALTYAPANLVSPFQYFQLFASVLVGYLFFAALPDAATWVGAGIIMASGLYIGLSQTRKKQ